MRVFSIKFFSDLIFIAFSSFVVSFCILNYFLERKLAITIALWIALVFTFICFFILKKKAKKNLKSKKDKILCEKVIFSLGLKDKAKINTIFFDAFSNQEFYPAKRENGIFLPSNNTLTNYNFSFDGATKTDIVKLANRLKEGESARLYCNYADQKVKDFSKQFPCKIEIFEKEKVYLEIVNGKQLENVVDENQIFAKKKLKDKIKISNVLDKKKSARFFLVGLSLLFMSFLVRYKVYYIISGTVFLFLALITRIFGADIENSN